MKLSKNTLDILNSYREINNSIVIYPGNKIRTKSEDNRIFAEAIVEETFDREFGIYDLKNFLAAYNILGTPELIFSNEEYVLLKEGRAEIKYYFSSSEFITSIPPDRDFQLKSRDVCIHLPQSQFNKMAKMSTFDSDRTHWIVEFLGEEGEIYLRVYHKDDPTSTSYSCVVGETENTFSLKTFLDVFLFMNGDYDIVISKSPFFLEATNTSRNLRYILPLSPESTYED
jgi:hypothetical protein